MEKCLVFIDSGFLSKVSKHFGGGISLRYDLLKFAKNLCGKENLIFKQLFYYTAPPFQTKSPSKEDRKRKENYDKFVEKIGVSNEITIREGRVQRVKIDGSFVYKQKGVDTLLTMDLMDVPLKNSSIKQIILIASDSDFVPIVKRLEELGINIILYTYFDRKRGSMFSTSNKLLDSVSKYVQLKLEDFNKSKSFF